MFRKILVPLDRSPLAESALPPALSLAERSGGELHLATVFTAFPAFAFTGEGFGETTAWLDAERRGADDYLAEVRGWIEETGTRVPIHTYSLSGAPVTALHDFVLENEVDQIVMTTHGRGRLERLWLGSVADGLVRRSPAPILLWRAGDPDGNLTQRPAPRRILVPLDGSEPSGAILPWVESLARLFGARAFLLTVAQNPPPLVAPYVAHVAFSEEARKTRRAALTAQLDEIAARVKGEGVEVETAVREGPEIAAEILAHAKEVKADLIALSTRGQGGAARLMLGSVADKLVRGGETHLFLHRDRETEAG